MSDHIKTGDRAFALFASALFALCAVFVVAEISEDSEAYVINYEIEVGGTLTLSTGFSSTDIANINSGICYAYAGCTGTATFYNSFTYRFSSDYSTLTITCSSSATVGLSGGLYWVAEVYYDSDMAYRGELHGYYGLTIVEVSTTPVTSISISGSTTGEVGSTITLTATTSPSSADDRTVTWSITSGSTRASITSTTDTSTGGRAVISLNSAGSVTVRATANDGSGVYATCTITITEPEVLVTSVSISGSTTVNVGSTLTLTATTSPTSADDRHVTWSITSGSSRVTYTTSDTTTGGRIVLTGLSAGSVTVRATAADGGGAYATYTITVVDPSNDFVLSYNANGGSGAPSDQNYSSTSSTYTATISATNPSRSGYTFLGWATTSTATSAEYQPGDTIVLSPGTTTLYAVWEEEEEAVTLTLTLHANGGLWADGSETKVLTGTAEPGSTVVTITLPEEVPTYPGYSFSGWFIYPDLSATYQPGATLTIDCAIFGTSLTGYAQWDVMISSIDITTAQGDVTLTVGQSFSYTVGTDPSGCTITVSGADWLSVSGSTISGTATAAGTYTVTVTASLSGYSSAMQTFTITVYSGIGFTSEPEFDGVFAYVVG